jgi:hypothetical protein
VYVDASKSVVAISQFYMLGSKQLLLI